MKLRYAFEYNCPNCGNIEFARYIKISEREFVVPENVTCSHCNQEHKTADHPSFEYSSNKNEFIWLTMAWEFDCPHCQKLSFMSFVPYKPPLVDETDEYKIEVMLADPPNEAICQHCGTESITENKM